MAEFKTNPQTGELAVKQGDGKWKIYKPGEFKFNADTGQYAVPQQGGKWQILDRVGPVKSDKQGYIDLALANVAAGNPRPQLSPGDAAMTAQSETAIRDARFPDRGMLDANLSAAGQGAAFNFADEAFGGMMGAKAALQGQPAGPEYYQARDFARGQLEADSARYPKSTMASGIAGNLMTSIPTALATGATSLMPVIGVGATQGGLAAYGGAKENDAEAAIQSALGAGLGAGGSAAGWGIGKLLQRLTTRGLAAGAVIEAVNGNTDNLMAEMQRLGMSAAETDEVLQGVLRERAAINPSAAIQAVPGAQQRLAQVNSQAVDDINRLVSPDNAAKLIADLQRQGQAVGSAGYEGGAYLNPATVGLVPEIAQNPAMDDALKAAAKLAAAEGRPFDVTNLGVKDLDAIQRALATSSKRMFESTPENTLLGPVYDDLSTTINKMAGNMAPELAQTQAKYAGIKSAQEAVELGKKALNPGKEFVEVAEEFANLTPEAQAGYKAGMATRLRALLQSKQPTANAATALKPEAIIEKLKAVGFPEQEINDIISRGGASRGVLDALQGGSDTARKLASAEAGKSPMTNLSNRDLMVAALTHWGTLGVLPIMRTAGRGQEKAAAGLVIKALTDQSPEALQGLLRWSPQAITPRLGLLGGAAATAASQTGRAR